MLTRQDANAYLAAILETLDEMGGQSVIDGAPSGHLYAGLMGRLSLDDYTALVSIAKEVGLVTVDRSHLVRITDKGREVVGKVRSFRAAKAS